MTAVTFLDVRDHNRSCVIASPVALDFFSSTVNVDALFMISSP